MTYRTAVSSVTFQNPFRFPGMESDHPPGTFVVETDTEAIDSLSHLAYRRVATRILLTSPGVIEAWTIDPRDLDAALLQDPAQS